MKQRFAVAALLLAVFGMTPVWAQCSKTCEHAKTCTKSSEAQAPTQEKEGCTHQHNDAQAEPADAHHEHVKDAKTAMCSSDVTCDGDVVRHQGIEIPRIAFKVGDTLTCCMKSATQLSGGDTSKIKYAVADQAYPTLEEAQTARLAVLEKFYEDMLTVKYAVGDECTACPNAAKSLAEKAGKPVHYRVANFDFSKQEDAEKLAKVAHAAGDNVTMTWAVGDEKFECPAHAAEAAKASNQPLQYCVGDQTTPCETTAKTRLVETRIQAAIDVLTKAAEG